MLDDPDGSGQVFLLLLALSRYDLHVLRVLLRCAGLIALCCACRGWSMTKHVSPGAGCVLVV